MYLLCSWFYIFLSLATADFFGELILSYLSRSSSKEDSVSLYTMMPEFLLVFLLARKRLDEHVHSVGRVLGDRSVLYKYLNPNLIAFASVSEDTLKPSTFIYIIDGVTGKLLVSFLLTL